MADIPLKAGADGAEEMAQWLSGLVVKSTTAFPDDLNLVPKLLTGTQRS